MGYFNLTLRFDEHHESNFSDCVKLFGSPHESLLPLAIIHP